MFASRPKMELVFSNLSPEDTGNVSMEIENMGIANTFDNNGNVFVPSDKRAKVRAMLAMKGKLPHTAGQAGSSPYKDVNPWGNDTIQHEEIRAIIQGQLAESIQFFDNVDSATVQVTPATDSPFVSDQKPAQANVTIAEKPGGMISSDEARGMANLVASAVPGLDVNKVTIFTRSGRSLWDGQDAMSTGSSANKKLELEKLESRKRRDELQEILNRMLGPGNAIASVDVTLDVSQVEKASIEHIGKPVAKQIDEKASNGGGAIIPPPGAPTATPPPSNSSGASYSVVQTSNDPELFPKTIQTRTSPGVGNLQSMAITVLVNKTAAPDAEASIKQLIAGYLGPKVKDTDHFSANVVSYAFDTSQADAAKKAEAAAAGSNKMQQIMSMLPIAALLIVAFLVVRSIGKLANRPMQMLAMAGGGPALSMAADSHFAGHAAHPKALDAANRFVLPEIVKQKAMEAGISEEQLQAAIEEAGDAGISVDDIPSIKSRVNVPLEQIKKMANEKPEVVAMLIKSWLIEEGIRR